MYNATDAARHDRDPQCARSMFVSVRDVFDPVSILLHDSSVLIAVEPHVENTQTADLRFQ